MGRGGAGSDRGDPQAGPNGEDPDRAVVRGRHLSWVWLIPAASLLVGGWLLYTTLARRGPLIEVIFNSAEGLQAGQSQVKYKDIQMGTVESFDLTPDRAKVVMHVRMTRQAEDLLTEGAQFWVVKPRVFAGDITGLNTILSGSYLEMVPGEPGKPTQRSFAGLANPPTVQPGVAGRQFHLTTPRVGSISVGSPVFFHDIEVGKVLGWSLAGMADSATLAVRIDAPYDQWVHADSRFWNTSGISIRLSNEGVQLQVDSVKAAVLGGITFDTPSGDKQAKVSAAGDTFPLYSSQDLADAATAPLRATLASYFTGTVGGLAVGAHVTLQGLQIGNVTAIDLQYDTDTDQARVRVEFMLQLDKVRPIGEKPQPPFPDYWSTLVAKGLRTQLKGGNLLTGRKEVAMEVNADAPPAKLGREGDVWIIPANNSGGNGGLDELSATANQLMAKIGALPFAEIGRNLDSALHGASDITNGPQLKQALTRLNGTLAATQDAIKRLDAGAAPLLRRLPAISAELQDTLTQAKTLVSSVSAGSSGDAKFGRDLDRVLMQVSDAAQSVRMVADLLTRHPEALIRGRASQAAN